MLTLTSSERRALRAKAHHLDPVVAIGQHGLTPQVLHEIDVALLAHELVKIRVFSDDRGERDALMARICAEMEAAAVQHLGKVLVLWRRAPEPAPAAAKTSKAAKPGKTDKPRRREAASEHGLAAKRPPAGSGKTRTSRGATGGKATQERRRAPATGKGPFEETRRPPRGGAPKPRGAVRRDTGFAEGAAAATSPKRRTVAKDFGYAGGPGENRRGKASAASAGEATPFEGRRRDRATTGAGAPPPATRRRRRQA